MRALFYAVPPVLLLSALLLSLLQGFERFVVSLLVPSFAAAVVGLAALHAVWRIVAIVDAWRVVRLRSGGGRRSLVLVALLSLAVLAPHGLAGYYVHSLSAAGGLIFNGGGSAGPTIPLDDLLGEPGSVAHPPADVPPRETPSMTPVQPRSSGSGGGEPQATTILFVGVDSGPGRDHALTDTLMVATFDPARNLLSMVSVPRDTGRVPLFDGGTYADRINSLLGHAKRNPDRFLQGPIQTLVREMEYLVGVPIDYYAVTDMAGLERAIELVGGIEIVLDHEVNDPNWGLHLTPGTYRVYAATAMRIVRSRYGPGNSDYMRARRQQAVIKGLAQRAKDPAIVARLPELFSAMSQIARSNIPVERLPDLLALLDATDSAERRSIVLAPPKYAQRIPPAEVGGRYMIELKMREIAALSVELFGDRSRYSK
ncbi:MAG TPA: LCP family protein [Candidatus Limnocylindria bacterium]|nr:LCP family protein [Candidatus Limnocylindria bacterium]